MEAKIVLINFATIPPLFRSASSLTEINSARRCRRDSVEPEIMPKSKASEKTHVDGHTNMMPLVKIDGHG